MSDKQRLPLAGARRKAREFALLGVYEALTNPQADFAAIDANLLSVITDDGEPMAGCDLTAEDFATCDKAFYAELLDGVMTERDLILEKISAHLDRDPARLSVVERACLMIGTWELMHRIENPYRVVINEAVELSKQFGADKGYRLVNGVLDKVAADVRPDEVAQG
ncbi:MAG: transcription antitermination factor NusB [Sutterellaceae bacterium]|nr:transcription antitermination factor NusB [Sutterellaceae bacterium]